MLFLGLTVTISFGITLILAYGGPSDSVLSYNGMFSNTPEHIKYLVDGFWQTNGEHLRNNLAIEEYWQSYYAGEY